MRSTTSLALTDLGKRYYRTITKGFEEFRRAQAEIERARRKPAASLDAYDLYLRAMPLIYAPQPQGWEEALALLNKASVLDPSFALAPAYAAWIYEKRISSRSTSLGNSDHDNCIALAQAALRADAQDPLVRAICAFALYRVGRHVSMLEALCASVRENPNNVVIFNLGCIGNQMGGAADEAFKCRATDELGSADLPVE